MKKIGIVGGLGWRTTADYYDGICRLSEQWQLARDAAAVPAIPEIVIESLDLRTAVGLLGKDGDEASWSPFDDYHRDALLRLHAARAEFAVIASNTPHTRFAAITRGIRIPVLSIFEATAAYCARIGAKQVLIVGTAVTMASPGFSDAFRRHGVEGRAPADPSVRATAAELIRELHGGELTRAGERMTSFVRRSNASSVGSAVCLACTELTLAFPGKESLASFDCDGVRYINAAAIHIEAAFQFAIADET